MGELYAALLLRVSLVGVVVTGPGEGGGDLYVTFVLPKFAALSP